MVNISKVLEFTTFKGLETSSSLLLFATFIVITLSLQIERPPLC